MHHSAFQIIFFLLKFLKNKRRKIKVYTLGLWFIKGHKNSPVHRDIWEETVQILKQHYYFFWDIQWNACNLHRVSWPGFDIPSKVFLYVFYSLLSQFWWRQHIPLFEELCNLSTFGAFHIGMAAAIPTFLHLKSSWLIYKFKPVEFTFLYFRRVFLLFFSISFLWKKKKKQTKKKLKNT